MPATRSNDDSRTPRRQPAVSTACNFCRRRKIRCNGQQPCDKCQQHDRADTCQFELRQSRHSSGTGPALNDAQDRIRQLEDRIASINRRSSVRELSSPDPPNHRFDADANHRHDAALNEYRHPPNQTGSSRSRLETLETSDGFGTCSPISSARQPLSSSRAEPLERRTSRSVGGWSNANSTSSHGRDDTSRSIPISPESSAVADIIADLGNPRHANANAYRSSVQAVSNQHEADAVMSDLHTNNRDESQYHGPTSASFHPPPEHSTSDRAGVEQRLQSIEGFTEARQQCIQLDSALLQDRLTTLAARERQQEVMNVVAGKLDFDGVEPELAIHLLNLHWNRQHHAYLVTYRPLFMRDMAAAPGRGKYFSKLLFHAILFGAAKFSDRIDQVRSDVNEPSTAGLQFLERVQQLLPEALLKSRITTVQALLLLACTHYARGSESAAWLHSGLAFRMAVDLGMNEDSVDFVARGKMALEELELRRRVVWAAYVIDKIHSLYQGRQASMERRNLHVPIEFFDHFEETEFWTPVAYHRPNSNAILQDAFPTSAVVPAGYTGPIHSVSTFAELCRLTVIMEKIIHLFYAIDSGSRPERTQIQHLEQMRADLSSWRSALPSHLCIGPISPPGRISGQRSRTRPPNLISLHALFHALTILLNRPFLPNGHLRSDDTAMGRSAWKACVDAASSISSLMALYRQTVSMKGAPQLISYINFCAAGIHVRLAAQLQQRQPSTSNGEVANIAAASSRKYELKALRQCLQDFEENQDPNPGVVKAKSVISKLAERAGILDLLQSPLEDGGLSPLDQANDLTLQGVGAFGSNGTDAVLSQTAARASSQASYSAAAHSGQPNGMENSTREANVSYELDFESILSSFDQFEASAWTGQDEQINGAANAAVNPDILFGFLRDYSPHGAGSLSNDVSLA